MLTIVPMEISVELYYDESLDTTNGVLRLLHVHTCPMQRVALLGICTPSVVSCLVGNERFYFDFTNTHKTLQQITVIIIRYFNMRVGMNQMLGKYFMNDMTLETQ